MASESIGRAKMTQSFFQQPILNSPYAYPARHWELDKSGQPTNHLIDRRRRAEFITPIPKPKKHKPGPKQHDIVFDEGEGLSSAEQQYEKTSTNINLLRQKVDQWRTLPTVSDWHVTPETARLLQHWRHHPFNSLRPFFCQVEAVETAIWLAEVAPSIGKEGKFFLDYLDAANKDANPGLARLALKLATGAGKTTVMAMLIAWQTINAVRRPGSKRFTRGFLIVTPGITIRDRLRVLQTNDPDSYYKTASWSPTTCSATWTAPRSSLPTTTPSSCARPWNSPPAAAPCCKATAPLSTRSKPKARCSSA
jgi:type III restriction enzyme